MQKTLLLQRGVHRLMDCGTKTLLGVRGTAQWGNLSRVSVGGSVLSMAARGQTRSFLFNRGLMGNNQQQPQTQDNVNVSEGVASAAVPPPIQPIQPVQTPATTSTTPIEEVVSKPPLIDSTLSEEFSLNLDRVITNASDIAMTEPTMTAITQMGDLKTLGLGGWGPVGILQSMLEAFYVTTGLPWWATIAICTVTLRLVLFPFVVKAQRTGAKMANLKPILGPIQAELKEIQSQGLKADPTKRNAAVKKMQEAYKEGGVNPFGGLWGMVQMPVFISMFFGLRAMAELPVPGFTTGGFLWFQDLSLMDPTYILPVIANGTMLVVMEYGTEMNQASNPEQAALMKKVFRFMIIGSMFFVSQMPAAVFVYWVTSNFLTLLQFLLLKNPKVREALDIPILKTFANEAPAKGLSVGISNDGMLAVRPMKFGEAWDLARDEAQRRKTKSVVASTLKK